MYRILEFNIFIFQTPNYINWPITVYKCTGVLIEKRTRTHSKFNGLIFPHINYNLPYVKLGVRSGRTDLLQVSGLLDAR